MPETDRERRPHPPPPPAEITRQPTTEDTTNNEELIFVSTAKVNKITDVATELDKLTTQNTAEESTSEGVTDQIRDMATELDGGVTVELIVIMPESDEGDIDYEEFIPGEIPDYSGSDNYNDFLPDVNKR